MDYRSTRRERIEDAVWRVKNRVLRGRRLVESVLIYALPLHRHDLERMTQSSRAGWRKVAELEMEIVTAQPLLHDCQVVVIPRTEETS